MAKSLTSPPPASTTTRAPRTRKTEGRQPLRRKPDPAFYYAQVAEKPEAKVINASVRTVHAGDLIITDRDGFTVDILAPDDLPLFYESADQPIFSLTPEQVTRCAAVLPIGATQDPESFTKAVASRIVFEGADLSFSTGQRQLLQEKAARAGKSFEQYMLFLRDRFCSELWNL